MDHDRSAVVGWIGFGAMGGLMHAHLLAAGHEVVGYVRSGTTPAGVGTAKSVAELAARSDVLITIVGGPADVEALYLGDEGVVANAAAGALLIDMTTSTPELARRIQAAAKRRGLRALDAPVTGGPVGARGQTLSIMMGGEARDVEAARPLLSLLGQQLLHHGPAGNGQAVKALNQMLVATAMGGICEAFVTAYALDLDLDRVGETLGGGIAGSALVQFIWDRLAAEDMSAGFKLAHLVKDLDVAVAVQTGSAVAAPLPATSHARELYRRALDAGHGGDGTQALVQLLRSQIQRKA